ncbi:hypothetical protein, partial [Pseudomonas aeruginosa]
NSTTGYRLRWPKKNSTHCPGWVDHYIQMKANWSSTPQQLTHKRQGTTDVRWQLLLKPAYPLLSFTPSIKLSRSKSRPLSPTPPKAIPPFTPSMVFQFKKMRINHVWKQWIKEKQTNHTQERKHIKRYRAR